MLKNLMVIRLTITTQFYAFIKTIFLLDTNFDWLSYHENVKKMFELTNESPTATPALLQLWKSTFSGRRRELETNVLPQGVFPVINTRCPILKLQQCVTF